MPIYLDNMNTEKKGRTGWCNLYCDPETPVEMLHEFAQDLGMKRSWFQDRPDLPHYSVYSDRLKRLARRNGAEPVDISHTVETMRAYRARLLESEEATHA
jgi:hypothetical protein